MIPESGSKGVRERDGDVQKANRGCACGLPTVLRIWGSTPQGPWGHMKSPNQMMAD